MPDYKICRPPAGSPRSPPRGDAAPVRAQIDASPALDPLDFAWHLGGFLAPAVGTGVFAAAIAKLTWRRALAGVPWHRLAIAAIASGALVLGAGLVVTGRDGRMSTYAAMVVACAAALWWVGFRPWRR